MLRKPLTFVAASGLVLFLLVSSGSATKLGEKCNIRSRCVHGLRCDPSPEQCGAAQPEGICVRVRQLCFQLYRPVCGCNGITYPNDCQRIRVEVAKRHNGKC